jgi:hypothetical protein
MDAIQNPQTKTTPQIPQISVMSPQARTPDGPTHTRQRSRDTGFPEPFDNDRNTTLPHPEADLSPNACISQDDIAVDAVVKHRRRPFANKHRRTVSHGYISPTAEAIQSTMALSMLDTSAVNYSNYNPSERTNDRPNTPSTWSVRLSKDALDSANGSNPDKDTPPSSPDATTPSGGRGKRFFERFKRT